MAVEKRPSPRLFESDSPEATEALAQEVGARLSAGSVVALVGELGSGKTCFVRGLARGLGVEARVSSPTFTLMHEYEGRLTLHHFDAWMEGRERAFLSDGGAEWLGREGVAAVEWAERVEEWLPEPYLRLDLAHAGPLARRLSLSVVGAGPAARVLEELLLNLPLPPGVRELRP